MPSAFVTIEWDMIDQAIERIGTRIRTDGFRPDCIVCILKGGMVPARLLSDFFGSIEIFPILARAYDKTQPLGRVDLVPFGGNIEGRHVLLVDDIYDTGLTLQAVSAHLLTHRPLELRAATVHYKRTAQPPPPYYAFECAADEWIVYPWERHEMAQG